MRIFGLGLLALAVSLPRLAFAQAAPKAAQALPDTFAQSGTLVLVVGAAALLPFAFMTLTAFVKISTVLQIARGAIGAQNIPTNTVILALSGALTLLAMAPVGTRIMDRASPVLAREDASSLELARGLVDAAIEPMRSFLSANASPRETTRFFELAKQARVKEDPALVGRSDLVVIIPAFVVSELIAAFTLGFAIYLPFLVVDLVVANLLLALGMQMMNPTQISLPFKLLLFVAADGWGLLAQALVTGYRPG